MEEVLDGSWASRKGVPPKRGSSSAGAAALAVAVEVEEGLSYRSDAGCWVEEVPRVLVDVRLIADEDGLDEEEVEDEAVEEDEDEEEEGRGRLL